MAIIRHSRPIYRFMLGFAWQACEGHDAIGPVRLFQRDAINDLPDAACVQVENGGAYSVLEPYRVRPVHTDFNRRLPMGTSHYCKEFVHA